MFHDVVFVAVSRAECGRVGLCCPNCRYDPRAKKSLSLSAQILEEN